MENSERGKYETTLPASWETWMQVKEQQLEPAMEQQSGSKLGKKYVKAVYCHPAYLTYMQSTSCEMPGWRNNKQESRLPGEMSTASICRWYHSNGRNRRGTKGPRDGVKEESEKAGLKINIQNTKIMVSGSNTS